MSPTRTARNGFNRQVLGFVAIFLLHAFPFSAEQYPVSKSTSLSLALPSDLAHFYASVLAAVGLTMDDTLSPIYTVFRENGYPDSDITKSLESLRTTIADVSRLKPANLVEPNAPLLLYVNVTCEMCRATYERLWAAHQLWPEVVPAIDLQPVAEPSDVVAYRAACVLELARTRHPETYAAVADRFMLTLPDMPAKLDPLIAELHLADTTSTTRSHAAVVIKKRRDLLGRLRASTPSLMYRGRLLSPPRQPSFDEVPYDPAAEAHLLRLAVAAIRGFDRINGGRNNASDRKSP